MKAAILQPAYLPWSGYFGLIDLVDVFIYYDDVQFVKQSWQQRNKIKSQNSKIWLTVPIYRKFGQKINSVRINNSTNWINKHYKSIYHSYNKATYFEKYDKEISKIYDEDWEYLCDSDIYIIEELSKLMKLNKPTFIKSSDIEDIKGKKTDRLLNILDSLDIDEYISGPAARNYIEPLKFINTNIKLFWYEFNHPIYPQIGEDFSPYMSVIDLLFNTGEESVNFIRKGCNDSLSLDSIFCDNEYGNQE